MCQTSSNPSKIATSELDNSCDLMYHIRRYRSTTQSNVAVPRAEVDGVKTPDLLWNGKSLEIKHTNTSLSALDKAVRRAKHQTNAGGVLIDITGSPYSDEQAVEQVLYRLNRSGGSYAIVFRNEVLVAYLAEQ